MSFHQFGVAERVRYIAHEVLPDGTIVHELRSANISMNDVIVARDEFDAIDVLEVMKHWDSFPQNAFVIGKKIESA